MPTTNTNLTAPVWHTDHPTCGKLARALTSVQASWQMLALPDEKTERERRAPDPAAYDQRWRDDMREALQRALAEVDALEVTS